MKTANYLFVIIIVTFIASISIIEACNGGTQPSVTGPVQDTTVVSPLILLSPSPNPSSGATTVGFTNSQKVTYSFIVVNIYGDTVYTMAMNQSADPGTHSFTIPASTLNPGTYIYSLQVGSAVLRKMLSIVK